MLLTDNKILVKAAKCNYSTFKVPVSMVEAKKMKRFYTPDQQADLDIKTSVNKIGEIINFSQILNNLYWNNIYHGQTHEENHEVYCDIAQLDVMSGIEIDRAKKEFVVENAKELDLLRNKYKDVLTDDDGKMMQPHFFAHISQLKGYYNPEKKNYMKHHSTMDYLQTVMNSYRRQRCGWKKDYESITAMLNQEKFRVNEVNEKQVKQIVETIRAYNNAKKRIYSTIEEPSQRRDLIIKEKDSTVYKLDSKIGYSTMYLLLSYLENPEYKDIRSELIEILFKLHHSDFYDVILESNENIEIIFQVENDAFFTIFGIKFRKKRSKE